MDNNIHYKENQQLRREIQKLEENRSKIFDFIHEHCETARTNREIILLESISTMMHEADRKI